MVWSHLSKFSDISNTFSVQRPEVGSDAAVFEVNNSSEGFIEEGTNGGDRESASFGSQGMDHCLESHIDFSTSDDLGDI